MLFCFGSLSDLKAIIAQRMKYDKEPIAEWARNPRYFINRSVDVTDRND
jgi:hypothetical protein